MKAYSLDLRQKIVDVYQSESISQRQLAQRFGVAKSFVIKPGGTHLKLSENDKLIWK